MSDQNLSDNSSCQFKQSFVMIPINLNQQRPTVGSKLNSKSSGISKTHADYEDLKLNKYLQGGSSLDESSRLTEGRALGTAAEIIPMATIDTDSLVVQQSEDFALLMKKYTQYDICLIGVTGSKDCGKSFFCDKVYNLADVKANNYCRQRKRQSSKQAGLFLCSIPFIKDNLCIFMLEIGGCEIKSAAYRTLITIALTLCKDFIFVHENQLNNEEKITAEFCQGLEKILKAFDFTKKSDRIIEEEGAGQQVKSFEDVFPQRLLTLKRRKVDDPSQKNKFFRQSLVKYLPNAMTPAYKGQKSDLTECSYLMRECVNPEYLKEVYEIFQSIYHLATQKKYYELNINGNITQKLLNILITQLNSRKKIKIHKIYDDILKDLYSSAFNFCVLSYHEELEEYFLDEKPKNNAKMYQIFERSANNAFERFEEFNLNSEMHRLYKKNLENHIDGKEKLINSINKQKTIELLSQHFENTNLKSKDVDFVILTLSEDLKELNDCRAEAVGSQLSKIIGSGFTGSMKEEKIILKLKQEIEKRNKQLSTVNAQKKDIKAGKKQNAKLLQDSQQHLSELKERKKEMLKEKERLEKRKHGMLEGTPRIELEKEKEQSRARLAQKQEMLRKLKGENQRETINQLQASRRDKIQEIKGKQKLVEEQIVALSAENPEKKDDKKKGKN